MTRSRDEWSERFETLVNRKTRLATSVPLPPYVTELEDPANGAVPVENAWSKQLFDGAFYLSPVPAMQRPACSLVFVQSADGNTEADDPGVLGGGNTDKHLIYEGLSRVAAHGVLAGAETVRGSEVVFSVWHPELVHLRMSLGLPRHPVQIVATIRGIDLDQALLFNVPEIPVLLLTVAAAAEQMRQAIEIRPWTKALLMLGPQDLPQVFGRLRSIGIERVSCVGGRTVAGQLLEAALVDDVYLTTGLNAGGKPGTSLLPQPWRNRLVVRKHGTGVEQGVTFEHLIPNGGS